MLNDETNITDLSNQDTIFSHFESIKRLLNENQLDVAKKELLELHEADVSDLIDSISNEHAYTIFSLIEDSFNPELLVLLSSKSIITAVSYFGSKKLADFVQKLSAEDAIEFMAELDDNTSSEILELLPEENRLHILEGFNYPENTTGRVMSKKYILFYEYWTVGQAIDSIRNNDKAPDDFHAAIVVNTKNKPVGTITLSSILKNPRTEKIKTIMNNDFKVADTSTSLDDLSYTFKHYALSVIPVINKAGKIVGTISIDNMVSIIEEQAEDAILHLGGVNEIDIYDTFITAAKQRFPWLFLNLIAACMTSFVINNFSPIIVKIVALASLMPLVASMGGNAGTQTMTVTIMAITNKDASKINSIKLILKELLTCGINGIVFAFLGAIMVIVLFNDVLLARVFSLAVVINFLIGGVLGSAIPIILDRLNQDPAPSSGVIVNALTDSCGFLIFLALAQATLM